MTQSCFEWLLTYLLHSSVLLATVALLDRKRRFTRLGLSSALWRIGLFGGFISASLQPCVLDALPVVAQSGVSLSSPVEHTQPLPLARGVTLNIGELGAIVVPVWIAVATIGCIALCIRMNRTMGAIRQMPFVTDERLQRAARMLARHAHVPPPRLLLASGVPVPFATLGQQIGVPSWMLASYPFARLEAALAHEFAHLRRNDCHWRVASRLAAIFGWIQPLNRLALSRLDASAESASDAWAARVTGSPRALAESLNDCAEQCNSTSLDLGSGVSMATAGTSLLERVVNLLEGHHMNTKSLRTAVRWSLALLIGVAIGTSFVVLHALKGEVPPSWLADNGLYQSLRNAGEQPGTVRTVVGKSADWYLYIRIAGDIHFDPNRQEANGGEGTAIFAETNSGDSRSVKIARDAAGRAQRIYKVNGAVRELDADGARWLAAMLMRARG